MSKSFRGISTRHFMSPRDRSALSRDYCANCVDLMVLSYTRILNGTKQLKTGSYSKYSVSSIDIFNKYSR